MIDDILSAIYCQKVFIVCLNSFLAHWAKSKYTENNPNIIVGKVKYLSIEEFLKIEPDN